MHNCESEECGGPWDLEIFQLQSRGGSRDLRSFFTSPKAVCGRLLFLFSFFLNCVMINTMITCKSLDLDFVSVILKPHCIYSFVGLFIDKNRKHENLLLNFYPKRLSLIELTIWWWDGKNWSETVCGGNSIIYHLNNRV